MPAPPPHLAPDDVRTIREEIGFSQKQMAQCLGLGSGGQKTVSSWENGANIPAPTRIAIVAMGCGWHGERSETAIRLAEGRMVVRSHGLDGRVAKALRDLDQIRVLSRSASEILRSDGPAAN